MINPNLALARINVTFPVDENFDSSMLGDIEYTEDELERLEFYGCVATATIFLKVRTSYCQTIELEESLWGITVFPEDHSYLGDCALEQVEQLRRPLEALGVKIPEGPLPFEELADEPLPLPPKEYFA